MNRCKKCVMPDTRPGLMLDEQGVCQACIRHEKRKEVNWDARQQELLLLRREAKESVENEWYDCIIPVSGGKDSHYQVKTIKEDLGMNPLLVNVSNFSWTREGLENYNNMLTTFDCECLSLDLSPATAKKMFRYSFEKYGSPTWYWDRAVYTYPLWVAKQFKIPLVIYGENISYEYGGPNAEDTPDATGQLVNAVADGYSLQEFIEAGVPQSRTYLLEPPDLEGLRPVYLSYYIPWSGSRNRAVAEAYGFIPIGQLDRREGYVENYDQIDAVGYLVHCWMKYPKYGHARATDVCSYWIREGLISRERAMELVELHDHRLDPAVYSDFIRFCGYEEKEFWSIVERFDKYNAKRKNSHLLSASETALLPPPR